MAFKQLLEYFVAHLEHATGRGQDSTRGYDDYIAPIPKSDFKFAGQGYRGHDIQKQIAGNDLFNGRQIFITVNIIPTHNRHVDASVDYMSEATYLNWQDAWTKIVVVPNEDRTKVTALRIKSPTGFSWNDETGRQEPDGWDTVAERTLDELGLFDGTNEENEFLRGFYNAFYERGVSEVNGK